MDFVRFVISKTANPHTLIHFRWLRNGITIVVVVKLISKSNGKYLEKNNETEKCSFLKIAFGTIEMFVLNRKY